MRKQSILQSEKKCFLTGSTLELDCHHIFEGNRNRSISEENGFWVWLRHDRHIADSVYKTPHNDSQTNNLLKELCQREFEKTHSREEFMVLVGKNYITEETNWEEEW